jgi:hypothetical protein
LARLFGHACRLQKQPPGFAGESGPAAFPALGESQSDQFPALGGGGGGGGGAKTAKAKKEKKRVRPMQV